MSHYWTPDDPPEVRRAQAEADFGVVTHDSVDALFADPAVDVVVVGTPPSTHAEITLAALAAGKHVVSEKPFALHLADVDRMLTAAAGAGRMLTVYQSRRWDPDFVAVHFNLGHVHLILVPSSENVHGITSFLPSHGRIAWCHWQPDIRNDDARAMAATQ